MTEVWFGVLALTLTAYAVLDGFDFGVGTILFLVAKTDEERRNAIAAIGPFWDGNEVWLIAAGGVLFVAFPRVLATAFPAFYLALFVVLWCLALRGVALEVRGHVSDAMWRSFWDAIFVLSSALLALLFGVALGNLVRGVPLDQTGRFTMPFFTDFTARGRVGLLDYYTLSVGAFALSLLGAHGASFLVWRTQGELEVRSKVLARRIGFVALALFILVTVETAFVRPELFYAISRRPLAWPFVLLSLAGGVFFPRALHAARPSFGFLASSALIAGLLFATAVGLYPTLLHSTLDATSALTAGDAIAPRYGLFVALVWWPIAFSLVLGYFTLAFRANRDKVGSDRGAG